MRWNNRRHDRRDGQIIDNGQVWCPAQATDVNVERCLSCGAYRDIVDADEVELLVCRPRHAVDASLPLVP